MVEGDFEQHQLYAYHYHRLDEQRRVEPRAGVIEDSARGAAQCQLGPCNLINGIQEASVGRPYLNIEATSMISGMSRENPALDLLRCIDMTWSL